MRFEGQTKLKQETFQNKYKYIHSRQMIFFEKVLDGKNIIFIRKQTT